MRTAQKNIRRAFTDNFTQYNKAMHSAGREEDCVPAIVVLADRMQQLRDWANERKEEKLQLFYDMLRSANSQGVYFVLTAFDKSELPIKYQPYVHGIALQLTERINYSEALSARIPVEWGGIREHAGRGLIAKEDKEAKQVHIYEIQTAVYGTLESDANRAAMIRRLGEQMQAAWQGNGRGESPVFLSSPRSARCWPNRVCKPTTDGLTGCPCTTIKTLGKPEALNCGNCSPC